MESLNRLPMSEDLVVLREILQRELETINAYERMLGRVAEPALRTIIDHITDEEREHVAEVYHLIMARDAKQRARDAEGVRQLEAMAIPTGDVPVTGERQTAAAAAGLTVDLLSPRMSPQASSPVSPHVSASAVDPTPPPAPIFPDGALSVGSLKKKKSGAGTDAG